MTRLSDLRQWWAKAAPFQVLPRTPWAAQRPAYFDAKPAVIDAALSRSQARPSGNWYAFAASSDVGHNKPLGASVAGIELVAWRGTAGALHVGPGACPHLGADLATATVEAGALVCPWHGLCLSGNRVFGWKPYPAHDDGVLVWVRLESVGGETPTEYPVVAQRPPAPRLSAVTRLVGTCEPRDIIANRLDPWHGAWFHPYSFTQLDVLTAPPADADLAEDSDRFVVAVTFRIGPLGVPVVAEFTSPEPRTIVMRIVEGEGAGSVVETHATPVTTGPDGRPRTAVLEAVVAHSDRPGFVHALRGGAVIGPLMRAAATRLWRDDLAYAERLYELRTTLTSTT
jgi:nitrite reductase/ring-hydroxylating ferredoxin subunit